MTESEHQALRSMIAGPLEIWTEGVDAACAILICKELEKRGLCKHERANATLARFTLTSAGRRRLLAASA